MVIQEVKYKKWDVYDCDGTKHSAPNPKSFFEAFGVIAGGAESMGDEWGMGPDRCTRGEIEIEGTAMYYDNMPKWMNLPGDFYMHPDLPFNPTFPTSTDRSFFPAGADSNRIKRTLKVSWNYCKEGGDKKTNAQAQ